MGHEDCGARLSSTKVEAEGTECSHSVMGGRVRGCVGRRSRRVGEEDSRGFLRSSVPTGWNPLLEAEKASAVRVLLVRGG